MNILVSKTHTMTVGRTKNNTGQIAGTSYSPPPNKLSLFYVIATKPVDIVFKQKNEDIKEVNKNYVKL